MARGNAAKDRPEHAGPSSRPKCIPRVAHNLQRIRHPKPPNLGPGQPAYETGNVEDISIGFLHCRANSGFERGKVAQVLPRTAIVWQFQEGDVWPIRPRPRETWLATGGYSG